MDQLPHSHLLRLGRRSIEGQVYLITATTDHRKPYFQDFSLARTVILAMRREQVMQRAQTLAFVVMPDHLHWLLVLSAQLSLGRLVGGVKSVVAHKAGQTVWQKGFHDHAVRREEDLRAVARYLVLNPVRAGLVARVGLYSHWDVAWL
jgi:REP element-mobilizing transposase RayT